MNTIEIINSLKECSITNKLFIGVFPIDLLPVKKLKRPFALICNTDKSSEPGTHWVAIFAPKFGEIEYFDSFGMKPLNSEIIEFINLNGISYKYNKKQIQSNKSKTCGKFGVIFIYYRSKKIQYNKFIQIFSDNKSYNEKLINHLFAKIVN